MKLISVDEKKMEEILAFKSSYKMGSMQTIIDEFIKSGAQIAEATDLGNYKYIYSAASSINAAAKNMHVKVRAITRKGHVYLIKTM